MAVSERVEVSPDGLTYVEVAVTVITLPVSRFLAMCSLPYSSTRVRGDLIGVARFGATPGVVVAMDAVPAVVVFVTVGAPVAYLPLFSVNVTLLLESATVYVVSEANAVSTAAAISALVDMASVIVIVVSPIFSVSFSAQEPPIVSV